jgi:hypothetical protein
MRTVDRTDPLSVLDHDELTRRLGLVLSAKY